MSGPIQAEPDQCEYGGGRMYPNYTHRPTIIGDPELKKVIFLDTASTDRVVSISRSGLGTYTGDFRKPAFRALLGRGKPKWQLRYVLRPSGRPGGCWWVPGRCFFSETACQLHSIVCIIRRVFSCRARSRPSQTNVSTEGAVCALSTHTPTIIGECKGTLNSK